MRHGGLIWALFIVLSLPMPGRAQDERSAAELRALPDDKAAKQARRDLESLLQNFSGYKVGNRLSIGDVWFWTPPRATNVKGMCSRDLVQLYYHPTHRNPDDYRTVPVRPYRIEARELFSFVKLPKEGAVADYLDQEDERLPFSRRCSAKSGETWIGWFEADNELAALQGYVALRSALAAVESGRVPLEEAEFGGMSAKDTLAKAVETGQLSKIERTVLPDGTSRWRIDALSSWITIIVGKPVSDTRPEDISSVSVEPYIVVT